MVAGQRVRGSIVGQISNLEVTEANDSKAETLVFINDQQLVRECVGPQLANCLLGWTVETIAQPEDISEVANRATISLIGIWISGAGNAADAVSVLESLAPGRPVVVMSEFADAGDVALALKAGARGYLLPSMGITDVASALRFVAGGGTYIPASVLSRGADVPAAMPETTADGRDFSPRQLEVLRLLREGKPNKIIAHELGMAEATAKVHVRMIMRKLNARNRTQVVLMTGNLMPKARPAEISTRPIRPRLVPLGTFPNVA
jgi:DNA-binding NarL/FixJ family response regulator